MVTSLKEKIGKMLCFFGFHKEKRIDPNRGVCGGSKCMRKDCDWKISPVMWPKPPFPQVQKWLHDSLEKNTEKKIESTDNLKMYILIREDTPIDIVPLIASHTAMLTYKRFRGHPLTKIWFETELQKTVICKVNPKIFEQAKKYGDYFALTEVHHQELGELGLGFSVQSEYHKFFKYLPLYKAE